MQLTTPRAVVAALVVMASGWPSSGRAQGRPISRSSVSGSAHRISDPPVLDGVLDERSWQETQPLTGFVQSDPFEGDPATEPTEVRILYDDKYLYVGVVCYDSDPAQIVTSDVRRDASLADMDSFQMVLDTFHDRQNGFVFGTNAAGSQYDALIRNEGEGQVAYLPSVQAGQGSGSTTSSAVNVDWDGSWDVRARITEIGWTAEFRIPLRTLRYGPPPQVWGLNFARYIRRKREQVYWSPVSRAHNLYRVSSAGELRGLELRTPRNFKVSPYAVGTLNKPYSVGRARSDVNGEWGIDAKYGVTPSMNLDLTYNTDFAQVEADQQQINLTRFNLVFPEKRPFFLENAGLFNAGKTGEVDLFYSRRIGIAENGSFVPIRGGGRLSGKTAGFNVGVMNIQTEAAGALPPQNFTALRVNHELPNRSRVGAIVTNRMATGPGAGARDWGRTWGADGKLGIGEALTWTAWAARTETPGASGRQGAFDSSLEYNTAQRRTYLEYTQVGEAFNPEVGFLQRPGGYHSIQTAWFEHVRTASVRKAGFRELYPHASYQGYWRSDGSLLSATLHLDTLFDWENGNHGSPAINIDWDGLDKPFEVYPGVVVPPGEYRAVHTAWMANTDKKKWLWASIGYQVGGFLSGHQNTVVPGLNIRSGSDVIVALTWSRNAITLPQGAFVTNLGSLRVTYNVSPLVNVQTFVQYNDRTGRWSTNLRFGWLATASTGLFLVYNDTEGLHGLGPVNRTFIVKYSRLFDLL